MSLPRPTHPTWWGRVLRWLSPSSGWCLRCGIPWTRRRTHTTWYTQRGMFPLCEVCWGLLTPRERLPYYWALYNAWDNPDEEWAPIGLAVMEGQ